VDLIGEVRSAHRDGDIVRMASRPSDAIRHTSRADFARAAGDSSSASMEATMSSRRAAKAGLASASIAALVLTAMSGCSSGSPAPGAASSPATAPASSSPTATATAVATQGATSPTPGPTSSSPAPIDRTVSSRVAYGWGWPNATGGVRVSHTYSVPPVPELVRISVGDHPRDPGERSFNRISFTFTTAFPAYRFVFAQQLTADPSGKVVPLAGMGVLSTVFTQAQAHTVDGTKSSIASQPARPLQLTRMVDYAQAGDFEGVLSYGVGVAWPIAHSNPQLAVRVFEIETITAGGQHLYTVAVDIDSANPGS
jgi:hypothetical protein